MLLSVSQTIHQQMTGWLVNKNRKGFSKQSWSNHSTIPACACWGWKHHENLPRGPVSQLRFKLNTYRIYICRITTAPICFIILSKDYGEDTYTAWMYMVNITSFLTRTNIKLLNFKSVIPKKKTHNPFKQQSWLQKIIPTTFWI